MLAARRFLDREIGWRAYLFTFLALAFAFRVASFGNPALHTDEEFYFLVGQRMLDGLWPYVDIWDRKPFGLFLIYGGLAEISRSVIAYQAAAALSAGLTAFILTQIVPGRWPGKAMAGFVYLVMLPLIGGSGGQTPVFYNLPMAGAAWLVARSFPELQAGRVPRAVTWAMLACGLALTIKQTVIVESAFFGTFALVVAIRAGLAKQRALGLAAVFAMLGAIPTLAIAVLYWRMGYFANLYEAMVTANFAKQPYSTGQQFAFAWFMLRQIWLPFYAAIISFLLMPSSTLRMFLGGWLVAALAALFVVPNFYIHYALPILLPVACLVGHGCNRFPLLLPLGLAAGLYGLATSGTFDREWHLEARRRAEVLAAAIDRNDRSGTLLVYDGPVYLYAMTRARPMSPLVMPWHFREKIERFSSGRDANAELARVLALKPGAVTLGDTAGLIGRESSVNRQQVRDYVASHCRPAGTFPIQESWAAYSVTLYASCE